jgi:hypothetical protein
MTEGACWIVVNTPDGPKFVSNEDCRRKREEGPHEHKLSAEWKKYAGVQ